MTALLAEFPDPQRLVAAAGEARRAGLRIIDAFSPFPVVGLGFEEGWIQKLGFLGMGLGALFGWWLQVHANLDYPLDIGGRPLLAAPAFMVLSFEFSMLGAGLALFIGMLGMNRLPRLHHPVFDAPRYSAERFFLLIDVPDAEARRRVERLQPLSLAEVGS